MHARSIEPSLVDNLLLKMQNPVSRRQRNDVKRGSGKMCLQVLRRQFKIFKIPKCLSKIKKKALRHTSTTCFKKRAKKDQANCQILKNLHFFAINAQI